MTRKRNKSGRDASVPENLDDEQAVQVGEHPAVVVDTDEGQVDQVGEHSAMAVDMDEEQDIRVEEHSAMTVDLEPDGDPASLEPQTPAPAAGPSAVFMEPLLPPDEAVPTTIQQQSEMSNYPSMPQHHQQVNSILPYGTHLAEAGVVAEVTADLDAAGDVNIGISTQPSIPEGSLVEEHCLDGQDISSHEQQNISMIWGNAVSPVSTSSDSLSSPSSSRRSAVTDMPSSPATTSAMATPVAAQSPGTSTNTHIQPQLQMSYYMSPPFSVPFTPGQPSFLVPGHCPAVSYVTRPAYTFSPPIPSPFQTFQYVAPPGPYTLRRYPYSTWGSYASGAVNVNWADANAQTQEQMQVQMQTQGHVQGKAQRKRGRRAASGEDVLRIVLVQPKNFHHDTTAASAAGANASTSTSGVGPISNPCERPISLSIANCPSVDVSRTTHLAAPADSEEQEAATVGILL